MMLHLAQPIASDDPLLMSDDERRAFMTPVPNPSLITIHPAKVGKTGFRGVQHVPRCTNRPFLARMQVNGRYIEVGYFTTAMEAAHAYDAKARELHGDYAILNFPDEAEAAA